MLLPVGLLTVGIIRQTLDCRLSGVQISSGVWRARTHEDKKDW